MNKLSKKLMCVPIRNGVEIWMEEDESKALQNMLVNITGHKFIRFGDRILNTADVVGIYTAQDIEEVTRRKKGEWQCNYQVWHKKNEKCECGRQQAYTNSGLGFYTTD